MINCDKCKDLGYIVTYQLPKGYKSRHNQRVRNYSGGRRPNVNDLKERVMRPCSCEAGEQYVIEKELMMKRLGY